MLVIKRDAGADQQDYPAHVEPDHEYQQNREPGIDRGIAGGAADKSGKQNTRGLPQHSAHDRAVQGRTEVYPGIRHQHVDEGKDRDHQHKRQQLAGKAQQIVHKGQVVEVLDDVIAAERGGYANRGKHQHRPDHDHAEVIAEALHQRAAAAQTPGVVKSGFDLLYQRDCRIEQQQQTNGAKYADLHILDEFDDAGAEFGTFFAYGCEYLRQRRLELIVHTESLQHRDTDRE